jgi:hypothetical protein
MTSTCYLRGGPEPVGVRTDNRLVVTTEPQPEIQVPVAGGHQGRFRQTDEQITVDGTVATVFEFVDDTGG